MELKKLKDYSNKELIILRNLFSVMFGMKPIVYVFDDYNNYIKEDSANNLFYRQYENENPEPDSVWDKISKYYKAKQTGENEAEKTGKNFYKDILHGFCLNLNSISLMSQVKAPPLWIPDDKEPSYELVASALPFDKIEIDRPQIAAFIIDFEWKPTITKDFNTEKGKDDKWKEMGYRAIELLSHKYPEIPSFLFTGIRDLKYLEQGLSHGASWCFHKTATHHLNDQDKDETNEGVAEQIEALNYLNLTYQLEEAAKTKYAAYQDNPFPDQFQADIHTPIGAKLLKQLKLSPPLSETPRGKALQQIIATLFPDSDQIIPVKVLTSGKSAAQATFFLKPENQGTRFIKIASWLSIQREYAAYLQVIQPTLNSYAAAILRKPVVSPGNGQQIPTAALMYSLAGFPEDYEKLRSLDQLMEKYLDQANGADFLITRLQNTLEKVIKPLFFGGAIDNRLNKEKRPLWKWLGHSLPHLSGVLIPLEFIKAEDWDPTNRNITVLSSYLNQGDKDKSAWTLASFALNKAKKELGQTGISPWDDKFSHKILLSGWYLLQTDTGDGQFADGFIVLEHPDLGLRIKLRGRGSDICQRFGATWIRPGMPVEVLVCLDQVSTEVTKIKERVISVAIGEGFHPQNPDPKTILLEQMREDFAQINQTNLPDPFKYLGDNNVIPYHYTIPAHSGKIHGDFNLQNILFGSEQDLVGWLIDFELSRASGMVAFDLAKLEVEIWNHHLSPLLANFANLLPLKMGKNLDQKCLFSNLRSEKSSSSEHPHYFLLAWALKSLEFEGNSMEFMVTQLSQFNLSITNDLILPIGNALKIISSIRNFALKNCAIDMSELSWCLAVYSLNAAKFGNINKWSSIFSFLASSWHLAKVIPQIPDDAKINQTYQELFGKITLGTRENLNQEVDGLLIKLQDHPEKDIAYKDE